jgi:photosystem II stability/assembly factor-like uncharacterized protein
MVDPSAERSERRNWWAGVAVITGFLLVGSLSLGYSLYRPSPAASEATAAEPTPLLVLLKASFVDETHGHLVVGTCDDTHDAGTCGTELRVTADGGKTWVRRALPPTGSGNMIGVNDNSIMYSLGVDRIVIDVPGVLDPQSQQLSAPGERFFTEDGGKTWKQRPRKPSGTVTEVPANGRLFYPLPDPGDGPTKAGEGVAPQVLRPDGTAALLAKGPPYGSAQSVPAIAATDGSIWAVAATPASVTHDHGRSWTPVKLPKMDGDASAWLRTSDGRHAYLVATKANEGLTALWSSADGAKSWHKLTLPKAGSGSTGAEGFSESADGAFLLLFDGKLYRYAVGDTNPREVQLTGIPEFSLLAIGDHAVVLRTGEDEEAAFFVTLNGTDLIPVSQKVGG